MYKYYAILYNFSFMAIGALTPLIGQYLNYAGYSGAQIGTITATGTAVAIFASAFWGGVYSARRHKYRILILLMILAAASNVALSCSHGFLLVTVIFGVQYFFQAPVIPLTDCYTVNSSGRDFGGLRTWGAVGFALGIFLTARVVARTSLMAIFPFYIVSYVIAAAAVLRIRDGAAGPTATQRSYGPGFRGYLQVLQCKPLRRLIICTFLLGGTNVANNTYFSFLYIEGGGTIAGVGVCMLIMVGAEAPFMAWSKWFSDKFTMERMILYAMIVSVLRFGAYATGLSWSMLLIIGVSQGFVNGILLVEFVKYAAKLAPHGHSSLAISAYYVIGSNLSTIVCQLIGGFLLDSIGADGVYGFFALFNLAGVILYVAFGLHRHIEVPARTGNSEE